MALNVSDASLGLVIVTANTNTPTPATETAGSYALVANGGTDSLTGIPDLSLSTSGLTVLVNNTGVNPNNLPGVGQGIPTPDGSLAFGFSAFTNAETITEVYGSISLNIAGLVSLSGNFVFEETEPAARPRSLSAPATSMLLSALRQPT